MFKLIILGTAAAVPDKDHENTHMVLVGQERMILIDSPGNPFIRLQQAGLDAGNLTNIILTHFHPDHVSGIPPLLLALSGSDRKERLVIHGNTHCISRVKQMFDMFDWDSWCHFPVDFYIVSEGEMQLVIDTDQFCIRSSPGKHYVPTIGLRIEDKTSGRVLVYTSYTAPASEITRLANGADILIHEAAGEAAGHSSAKQAGNTAQQAGAEQLYLIHYPLADRDPVYLEKEAAKTYGGIIRLAEDFIEIDL